MYIAGIALYVAWFLLAILKISNQPQNRKFSYKKAFFGSKLWFTNLRNLMLLASLYLIFVFAPLKTVFLLLLLSLAILLLLSLRNFFLRIANPYVDLLIVLSSAVLLTVLSTLTLKL